MPTPITRCLIALVAVASCSASVAAQRDYAWPNGAKAAVSLAYDDALDSQLDAALPALDRHDLKASFYLTLGSPTVRDRLDEWREAAARGHELGNHSLFHQCSRTPAGRGWVTPELDLDRISAARMIAEVRVGNAMLHAIDGRRQRTFTVPCGDAHASGEDYVAPLAGDFIAIKRGTGAVAPGIDELDVQAVPVIAPSDASGAELIALVEAAAARGTMANITFHGVGGDHLAVSADAHEALLAHLAAHRDVYWTAPFIDIMRHVETRQAAARASDRELSPPVR